LARIKGKGPARRGVVPPNFGTPIPFNPAFPVYGGKTMKTSIVGDNCTCPITRVGKEETKKLYHILINPLYLSMMFSYKVGDVVYATTAQGYNAIGIITDINGDIYTVIFEDESTVTTTADCLLVYFPCNCSEAQAAYAGINFTNGSIIFSDPSVGKPIDCYIVNNYFGANSVFNIINFIKNLLPEQYQNFLSYYNT
jgi:hypothetical protein